MSRKGWNPWVPLGSFPDCHHQTHLPELNSNVGQGHGSDSDNDKEGVTDTWYNVDFNKHLTRSQGSDDTTRNQPEQCLRARSLIQLPLKPCPVATTLFPEPPPPQQEGHHLSKKVFLPPEHSSVLWCQESPR